MADQPAATNIGANTFSAFFLASAIHCASEQVAIAPEPLVNPGRNSDCVVYSAARMQMILCICFFQRHNMFMRTKKDTSLRHDMCARFIRCMDDLQLTPAELARRLGYLNATTITRLRRGETFVDVERLYLLSLLRTPDGRAIDLNWLITGHAFGEHTEEQR